jgi:hypothetical protein
MGTFLKWDKLRMKMSLFQREKWEEKAGKELLLETSNRVATVPPYFPSTSHFYPYGNLIK